MQDLLFNLNGLPLKVIVALFVVAVWTVLWKGLALWKAARKGSKVWFVVLLLVNTVGILEILYIFLFSEINFSKKKGLRNRRKR